MGAEVEPIASRLVGRRRELALIGEAWERPGCAGVVIAGPPGVGKTRLAREAIATASADGAASEWAQATRSAATIPLAAFARLLPRTDGPADPLRHFQHATDAILARANGRPVVLGLDDAHLLDQASAALALHLATSGSAFLVATVRAGEPCPDAIVALWKDAGARRLDLEQLSEAETVALTEQLLGGPVEGMAAQWAYAMSAGNPLYLRELLATATEDAALELDEGLWRLRRRPAPGPALRELVAQRLDGLDEPGRELLALLGLGEPLAVELVEGMAVADAESRGLVVVEGAEARLAHPLYGEVVVAELSGARAAELRVRLADAVRARGVGSGDALRVASWLRDAQAPVDPGLLLRAAEEAHRGHDPELAARLAAAAVDAGGGAPAALMLGHAQSELGRYADADATLASLEGGLPSAEAAAGYLFARVNMLIWGLGRGEEAERLVGRAAHWWTDPAWRRHVDSMGLLVLGATGRSLEAGRLGDDLVADPEQPVAVAAGAALGWMYAGQTAKAQALADRAVPPAPGDEQLAEGQVGALVMWAVTRLEAGRDWDEAEARVARIEHAAVQRGDRVTAGPAAAVLGSLALGRGKAVTAARRLREAVAHLELRDRRGLTIVTAARLAHAEARAGRLDAALRAQAAAHDQLATREPLWHERGRLAAAAGWIAIAGGELARGVDIMREGAESVAAWPVLHAELLHQVLSAGADARELAAPLADAAGRCDAPLAAAYALHATGLADRDPAALERAADALRSIGALLSAAEAAAQAASAYADDGRMSSARRAAALSARLAAECEGVRTPALRATDPGSAELTPREREIAELAGAGQSNAEIAAQLHVSVRTVESHLYHAMTKLGVERRHELGAHLT
ncbi:MAG TPA: LuxR C-terminal-related transcriptional regulator [Solirubrobacteraceae bacterium]